MATDTKRLWKKIGRENVWGRRGLIKANSVWISLALLVLLRNPEESGALAVSCLQIYLTVCCWVLVSILANDLSDWGLDSASDKQRWIGAVSYPGNWAIVIAMSVAGLGIGLIAGSPAGAKWAYLGATVLSLSYSLRPFRAKERGAWGIFIYSLSCTFAYVLIPWTWLGTPWPALLVLSPAVFLDKWVNLHFHETLDYETDAKVGIQTLAVRVGIRQARRWLYRTAGLAAAAAAALLAFTIARLPEGRILMMLGMIGVLAISTAYVLWERRRSTGPTALVQALPWPYLASTLTAFRALPFFLIVWLASSRGSFWAIAAPALVSLVAESLYTFRYRIP